MSEENDQLGSVEPHEPTVPSDNVRASWNFSLEKIRQDIRHFSQEEQDLLVALFRWCIDPLHPIRRDEAASRIGFSSDMIYQLLTGKYRNPDKSLKRPSKEFLDNLREFLASEAKKHAALSSDFVITPTAKKIFTACNLARESHSPVILSGTSHIGKTWGLKYDAAHNNHGKTFFAEMEAASGRGGMVRVMGRAAGVGYRGNAAKMLEKVTHATTSNTLWIFDEVHLLRHTYQIKSFFACIETIRRLYDFTQCGMVLSWTHLADLENSKADELMQVWRRGVHKVMLPNMPTKADLEAILKHHGLEFPSKDLEVTVGKAVDQPYAVLRQLAKNQGLKSITERIRYAHKLANKKDGKIAWENFIDAHLRIAKNATPEPDWD